MNASIDAPADRLYEATYKAKMQTSITALRVGLVSLAPSLAVSEAWDMSGDDYSWAFTVKPAADSPEDDVLDVTLKLDEQAQYEGEGNGLTFSLDMVWWGGEIAGGMAPYNYTDECWVDSSDEAAVAERYSFFEGAEFVDSAATYIVKAMTTPPSARA